MLNERNIKQLHHLLVKNIDDKNAGTYRNFNVMITGAQHIPPDFLKVPQLMADFVYWYELEAMNLHPIERAARVHSEFVKIHPFAHGNGRTSRLLMNLELMFIKLMIEVVEQSFEPYYWFFGGSLLEFYTNPIQFTTFAGSSPQEPIK